MPLLVIPYPNFDPVLVHLGPFAIRWYALAISSAFDRWAYARLQYVRKAVGRQGAHDHH